VAIKKNNHMETTKFHEYNLSRFMMGTVQFGVNYGIANLSGKPSYESVVKILERAAASGVTCLDTAAAYGDSEMVIGRALRELGLTGKMTVVTKTPHLNEGLKPAEADKAVQEAVESSLKKLQLEFLPLYLFHKEANSAYIDSVRKMKQKGLVKHIGISVNSPEWALKAVRSGNFEAIQLPTNILDHRYIKAGVFKEAKRAGIAVFVRSVYLQGLLFLPENKILPEHNPVIEVRRRLGEIARESGLTLTALAARFVMSLEGVYCLVMGLETIEQLQDNLKLFEHGLLGSAVMDKIMKAVPLLPDIVLMPWLWPKAFHAPPQKPKT